MSRAQFNSYPIVSPFFRLQNSRRMLIDTENLGNDVLGTLQSQRKQLENTR